MSINKNIFLIIAVIVILILINKQCEKPKEVIKTVVKTEIVKEPFKVVEIQEVPKTVYINKYVNIKGKDSIVYVDKANDSTIEANQYDTTLKSNEATAEVKITTTGQLLDVSGVITYPKVKETVTVTKTKDRSGLFIYGDLPITNNFNPEIGAIYQFKNRALFKGGVQYNEFTKALDVKIGVGIKIF